MSKTLRPLLVIAAFIVMFIFLPKVNAATPNISKSYGISQSLVNGIIVSTSPNKTNYVVPASVSNDKRLLGVIVKTNDSLLAIDTSNTTAQVAITGTASTLVSDVGGNINVGDEISVSPFIGIGMKETSGYRVVGVAETPFNAHSPSAAQENVTDITGKSHNINVGYVVMTVDIGSGAGTGAGGNQPNLLQKLVKDITGHTISTARIVISLIVSIVALLTLVTMIYASIHGSIISMGRNPLAKSAIYKSLSVVFVMSLITVGVACSVVYFLLK